MPRPVLSLLRVRRMSEGLTMAEAADRVQVNVSDYGRVERLASKPSKRVAQLLSDHYKTSIERLLSEVKA